MTDRGSTTSQIGLHAMAGVFLPQTLKFIGSIDIVEVYVLVDGGGNYNFIQSKIISMLNLPITSNKQFQVMVGMAIAKIYNYMWVIWFWVSHVSLLKPYRGGEISEVRTSSLIAILGLTRLLEHYLVQWV